MRIFTIFTPAKCHSVNQIKENQMRQTWVAYKDEQEFKKSLGGET